MTVVVPIVEALARRTCRHDWHEITTPLSDFRGRIKKDIVCRWCGVLRFPRWASIFKGVEYKKLPEIAAAELRGDLR